MFARDGNMDLDFEGPQKHGDSFNPKPIDEPMYDVHAEIGLDQGHDPQHVLE